MAAYREKSPVNTDKNIHSWRHNTNHAKKTEIIKELKQLDIKVQNMDREKATHLYNKRSDFRNEFSHLEDMDLKLTQDRTTEKVKVRQQLNKIRNMVKKFHKELQDVKPTPEFLEKLKIIMEDIEGTVSAFKEQQKVKYEQMLREERTTTQEISAIEKKLEAWAQMPNVLVEIHSARTVKPLASARDVTKDLPDEVAAFERFLEQTGGHRGGWDEYDHQMFLKYRNKHKGKSIFIRECLPLIPTRSEDAIREHESWYQEYLVLNDRKRDAIQKWRIQKQQEKDTVLSDSSSEEDVEKKKEFEKRIEREKNERFSRINAWKVQQELEKAQKEEKQLKEELRKAKETEMRQQLQAKKKAEVEVFRRQKQEDEDFQRLEEEILEQEEKRSKHQQLLKQAPQLQERNKKILEKKLSREKAKQKEKEEKIKRLERIKGQVEVEVKRDPSRLYKMTKGWEERTKEVKAESSGPIYTMPHRAVPSWRAGLH